MRSLLTLLSTVALVSSMGIAQAQNANTVVPQVVAPETTRSTVQGTSDAATKANQGTEAKSERKDDARAEKKGDARAEKPKATEPKK